MGVATKPKHTYLFDPKYGYSHEPINCDLCTRRMAAYGVGGAEAQGGQRFDAYPVEMTVCCDRWEKPIQFHYTDTCPAYHAWIKRQGGRD